jgi:Domain of unknown function (DUF4112)
MKLPTRSSERPLEGELLGPERPGERETREKLQFLAWLLDSSIPIPGTRLTIGLDAIIGLIPFIGDLIGVAASSIILAEAHRLGVPRAVMTRMAFNVAVEGVVGIVPFFGDIFDAGWKANQKNVRLLTDWMDQPHKAERGSRRFVVLLVLGLLLLLGACSLGTWFLLKAIFTS